MKHREWKARAERAERERDCLKERLKDVDQQAWAQRPKCGMCGRHDSSGRGEFFCNGCADAMARTVLRVESVVEDGKRIIAINSRLAQALKRGEMLLEWAREAARRIAQEQGIPSMQDMTARARDLGLLEERS